MSNQKSLNEKRKHNKEGRTFASVLFSVLGTLIITVVLVTCIPAAVPRIFGYEIYNIVSGSMEPELSVGSAVYVKQLPEEEYRVGDVIAFYVNDSIMVHRLIEIDEEHHEFHTKGDANAAEDMNPIPVLHVIGRMEYKISSIGKLMVLYSTLMGKIYVICFLFVGILFHMISGMLVSMKKLKLQKEKQDQQNQMDLEEKPAFEAEESINSDLKRESHENREDALLKKKKTYRMMKFIMVILAVAFLAVVGMIIKTWYPYYLAKKNYQNATNEFVKNASFHEKTSSGQELVKGNGCPISVDFKALQEINPEVIGWIYCEDTVINYPICRGEDDEYYLKHAYDHTAIKSGCIFMETENKGDFSDANTIIYGHHMKDGSMFASLAEWSKKDYFESHSTMWLLTPDGDYRIELFSGYITDAASQTYTVFQQPGEELISYLNSAVKKANVKKTGDSFFDGITPESLQDEHFVVLSTCDYTFENARYVLHGRLIKAE